MASALQRRHASSMWSTRPASVYAVYLQWSRRHRASTAPPVWVSQRPAFFHLTTSRGSCRCGCTGTNDPRCYSHRLARRGTKLRRRRSPEANRITFMHHTNLPVSHNGSRAGCYAALKTSSLSSKLRKSFLFPPSHLFFSSILYSKRLGPPSTRWIE